jgi:hypothetical protein
MFSRPNGKSRPPSDGGHGHARKRRSQKEVATDASQLPERPEERPVVKKKKEPRPVLAVVPDKVAEVHRWAGGIAQTGESGGRDDRVAAVEELVQRLERRADEQQERTLDGLKRLEQVVGEAADRIVRRAREDAVAVTGALEQLRQEVARVTVAGDDRPQATSRSEKRPAPKKKLEAPVVVPAKGPEVDKVVPETQAETGRIVAEGPASSGEASATYVTDSGPAQPVYKKPSFLAKA